MRILFALMLLTLFVNTGCQDDKAGPVKPDNTAVNERDRDGRDGPNLTPIDQNENEQDVKITADIRQKLVGAETLSVNGRNVKVITQNGVVTLRGPVGSATERDTIETIARQVAGPQNVRNELEVAP